MKDKSNFYNLSQEEQKKESKDLWKDSFPNIPGFAENLKKTITQEECPRVITLEGGYGMGKTYFSSRFCEYLETDKSPISSVYFSAWENDNLPDPFLSFSKAILTLFPKKDKRIKKWKSCFVKLLKSFNLSVSMKKYSLSIDFEKVINAFCQQDNPINTFKSEISQLISILPHKKLVIIVDELDRCCPDYTIKVLETIKHFFDIDGITILLPINYDMITSCIKSVYSLENSEAERYLRKFINYRVNIPDPNYKQFIEGQINENVFKEEIVKKYLDVENIPFCSLKVLQEDLIRYSEMVKPSLRELTNLLNVVELAIRAKKDRIRCSLLVHLLFKKFIKDNRKEISADRLPVNDNLKLALGKHFESLVAQYGNYVNGSINTYCQNLGNLRHKITRDQCEAFIDSFKQINTYGEMATLLKERNGLLDTVYGCSWSGHDAFVSLCEEIQRMINMGINDVGVFEIKDALNTRPQVEEYKKFVNFLKI